SPLPEAKTAESAFDKQSEVEQQPPSAEPSAFDQEPPQAEAQEAKSEPESVFDSALPIERTPTLIKEKSRGLER
ncbi:hypothetical protein, partial [Floridanema evergladense]